MIIFTAAEFLHKKAERFSQQTTPSGLKKQYKYE